MADNQDAIDKIEDIRRINNTLWMAILRIALANSRDATQILLRRIIDNDQRITSLLKNLAWDEVDE